MSAKLRFTGVVLCLAAVWMVGMVAAQGQQRTGQRTGTRRDRTNQGDPAAMRQGMMQRMQQQLGASDAEWQVIQPRLQKVTELSRQIDRRGPGGRRGQGQETQGSRGQARRPRTDANREKSAVQKAYDELQTVLSNTSATPEQVEAKLAALRTAREAAKQNLAKARTELQQVLTIKQEARLVLMGLLE